MEDDTDWGIVLGCKMCTNCLTLGYCWAGMLNLCPALGEKKEIHTKGEQRNINVSPLDVCFAVAAFTAN